MSVSETDTESGASSSMGKGSFSSADLRPNKSKSGTHHHHIHHRGTWPRVQETLATKSLFWPSVALLLATMLILVSMMSGFFYLNGGNRPFSSNMCLSVDCITAASDMLRSLDHNVDPCDDYYEYACGGWIRLNSIQDDESRADTYSVIRNQMSEKLKCKFQIHFLSLFSSFFNHIFFNEIFTSIFPFRTLSFTLNHFHFTFHFH